MRLVTALSLLLWVAIPPKGVGPSGQTSEPPFRAVSGAMFALSVADLNASERWYSEKLGLKVVSKVRTPDNVGVAILEGAGLIVELIQNDSATPRSQGSLENPALARGIFKVGIVIDDLERALAALRARGVEIPFGPYPAKPQQRANAIIRDNAGNLIQLFAR